MAKKIRVVTSSDGELIQKKHRVIVSSDNNYRVAKLTENEKKARRYATTTTMGGFNFRSADTLDSGTSSFYSPQLSSDFLEKPQNLRERRAFYRFFYNTNEIIGRAIDIHSTLPLSKLRLVPPKGSNKHQNEYVYKFFLKMCDDMKLFKTLIEVTHEYYLMGNCLPGYAEVREIGGFKKAEDIKIGDLLLTDKGRYREVTKTCTRKAPELYKIKCWKDYREIPVTGEHPIEILKDNSFIFEKAEKITTEDYVRVTWPKEIIDIDEFPLNPVENVIINNDFCYFLGLWIGSNDKTVYGDCLKIRQCDGKIRAILENIFGPLKISGGLVEIKRSPVFTGWWMGNFVDSKHIPSWVISLPIEKLRYLLSGILDSDSGKIIDLSSAQFHIESESIRSNVREIILKCGGIVDHEDILKIDDIFTCEMISQHAYKDIPLRVLNNSEDTQYFKRLDNGDIAFKVKSITKEDYNNVVYNFEVEEDHTYQVSGFSTHNCIIFAEDHDPKEGIDQSNIAQEKEKALNRIKLLKEKYSITDKNPLYKGWKKLLVLPPDQVKIRKLPLSDEVAIEYVPDAETRKFLTSDVPIDPTDPTRTINYTISDDLKEKVRQSGTIPLDTDPNSGSHAYLLARKKSQYEAMGISIVERCVNTLVLMDKLRQAQTSIASRHMTPMRIVWSEGMNNDDVDNLREQVDMALVDPDFSIIANYEIHWEEMGSQGRLLDIEAENEYNLNRLFAGLGVTREILTGEGAYSGSKINLEIMNTEYLLFREILQDYVENYLFKPVAKRKGFVEYDDYGNEILLYPRLSFTRLAIRDNDQYFDAAFQLYQKGSISIDLILDILNIDSESTKEKIEKDLFTVNDSLFNEVMRNIYTNAAAPLVEQTDLVAKMADYLKLQMTPQEAPPAEGASRFSSEERKSKLTKVMKYLANNPEALDKISDKKLEGR